MKVDDAIRLIRIMSDPRPDNLVAVRLILGLQDADVLFLSLFGTIDHS